MSRVGTWIAVGAIVLIAAVVFVRVVKDDAPPYTYKQLMFADIDCGAEDLSRALVGSTGINDPSVRGSVANSLKSGAHPDCLAEKLPKLSRDQIEHFSDTVDEARAYEREH